MEIPRNAINWFEIPVSDFGRAKKFYSAIFEYEMPEMTMGPVRMGILPHDQQNGGIGGAIVEAAEGYTPSRLGAKVYLNAGNNLYRVLHRVEEAGGKCVTPKFLVGQGMGYVASFIDTEGNEIYLHSPE